MAFKLSESAQTRWRAVNAPHLVALVRAGAVFRNGKLIDADPQVLTIPLRPIECPVRVFGLARQWGVAGTSGRQAVAEELADLLTL